MEEADVEGREKERVFPADSWDSEEDGEGEEVPSTVGGRDIFSSPLRTCAPCTILCDK